MFAVQKQIAHKTVRKKYLRHAKELYQLKKRQFKTSQT